MKSYPKYIMTYDGYIGTFSHLEYGEFPTYRIEGQLRIADNWEVENGADTIEELKKKAHVTSTEHVHKLERR